eukprot:CAMPEP_0116121954 /NCGR_PEP_ID=MMETSP0329-20121206/3963_1 /TAXON_ID=697910 /ORGANISM="Pseudo-nitzschia arenysensis, Strain B593" /LENGTH=400 /DNA_ID=CAMNT_0003615783 /DNA_START=1 /DNA_END=1203 /DNA_ORIENTATION=+
MMISRFFRTPPSPGKIAVTEAHIAPRKEGAGIIIRKRIRKEQRQLDLTPSHCDSSDDFGCRRDENLSQIPSSTTTCKDQKKSTSNNIDVECNDNDNDQDRMENNIVNDSAPVATSAATETATVRFDTGAILLKSQPGNLRSQNGEEKVDRNHKLCSFYFPKPGDICVIRYDCYLLSSLQMTRGRHGILRISELQNFQNRQRAWIDGNFSERPLSTRIMTTRRNDNACDDQEDDNTDGEPCTFMNDPYCDGESSDSCKLKLPALEFEIGAGEVIRGLEVVVQRMVEGEIVEATIPHLYAYGYKGLYPRIAPKSDLYFVVKLERVIPSVSNAAKATSSNQNDTNSEMNSTTRIVTQDIVMFCCGIFEGTFMVVFGIAIPVFLLLRSELDLEEIIRDLASSNQ